MWSDSIRPCSLCWIPPKHQRVGKDTRQPQKGIGHGTSATVVSWQTAFFTISDTIRSQSWLGQDMLACSTGPITKYIPVWWLFEARICTNSGNTAPQITSYLCKLRGISPLPKLHESLKLDSRIKYMNSSDIEVTKDAFDAKCNQPCEVLWSLYDTILEAMRSKCLV